MSTPNSRLSKYRTYSYYHIVALCDSTDTATQLSTTTDFSVWTRQPTATPSNAAESLGRFNPITLPEGGSYIILMDGATDADVILSALNWTTLTALPSTDSLASSISLTGNMTFSEPKGIVLLDRIVRCTNVLNVGSATWCIKTVFIGSGYDSSRGDFQDIITDIPPIMLMVTEATASFTEEGGFYQFEFVSMTDGMSRVSQYGQVTNTVALTAGGSLEQTVKKLEQKINDMYDTYFTCVTQQIAATKAPNANTVIQHLRKVKYQIDVGDVYKDDPGPIKYTVTNQSSVLKNGSKCNDPAQLTYQSNNTIEAMLEDIMAKCPQAQEDLAKGDPQTHLKYEYKIRSTVETFPPSANSLYSHIISYRIERYPAATSLALSMDLSTLSESQATIDKSPEILSLIHI